MTSNVFPVSYIEPCFLLSSPRFYFPSRFFSIPYTLSTTIISISLSLHLVLMAPVNSYYLVLSFLLMYSSGGLSIDIYPNKGPSIYDVHTEGGGGSGSGGRMWTGGPAPCGRPHRKLKLESTDVILSSSHAKKLASFLPEFRLWTEKNGNFSAI